MEIEKLRKRAAEYGQEHLFQFWKNLSADEQAGLAAQVAAVDFALLQRLEQEFQGRGASTQPQLEPAPVIPIAATEPHQQAPAAARGAGEAALRAGRVGCFLVAGGQGTRLGISGPKGAFEIGPVTRRTLFQIHAEKILALRRIYGAKVPWVIMTSTANDAATRAFFAERGCFGLDAETIRFCVQENLPAVSLQGKLLLETSASLCWSPNGHGGSIKALHDSGSLRWLRGQGVDTLFYFQVDNPLTRIGDPLFLGHHLQQGAEMSSKVVGKCDWKEKVGVVGTLDGKLSVIEYSDLPEDLARATEPGGRLRFWAGNIAIHVLDVGFIERLNAGGFQLPYHRAEKAVPCLGPDGSPLALKAGEKNGVKFETFVFDALPLARAAVTVETRREVDFAPVKNATGVDSPESARHLLQEQYAAWLLAAGHPLPRKPGGALDCRVELSPLTSLAGEGLQKILTQKVLPGSDVVL